MMNVKVIWGLTPCCLVVAASIGGAIAAESARGVYLLGSRSQYSGVLPGPGAFFQNDVYLYSGRAGGNLDLPIGGLITSDVEARAVLELPTALYFVPAFGGLFGMALTTPMGSQEVDASATFISPGGVPFGRGISQDAFRFGDPYVQAILGWTRDNWHWNVAGGVNVPVGEWNRGSLVNLAFNRWAVDVTGSVTYLDMTRGLEASAALGVTFNGDNLDLDYRTGTEMHAEWSLTQLTASGFSIGLAGYHYQQISGDSGSDARAGSFKGRVTAIGPAMGLTVPLADRMLTAKFRAYQEFNVKNRLEGISAIATVAIPLQGAAPQ
jgi:hypothetical protein